MKPYNPEAKDLSRAIAAGQKAIKRTSLKPASLRDMRCPACKDKEGSFHLEIKMSALVFRGEFDLCEEKRYSEMSECKCDECGFLGMLGEFLK